MKYILTIVFTAILSTTSLAAESWTLMYRVPYKSAIEYQHFSSRETCRLAAAIMKGMFKQQLIGGGQTDKDRIRRIVNSRVHCVKT